MTRIRAKEGEDFYFTWTHLFSPLSDTTSPSTFVCVCTYVPQKKAARKEQISFTRNLS